MINQIHKFTYPISVLFVLLIFLSANRVRMPYTPYQILVWELKANEGYRSWWYRDGWNNGRRAYSIGFGWNDLGNRRRSEIKEYTKDGRVDFNEALEISLNEIKKYGRLHKDPYKNLALLLYSYNCGLTKDGSKLGRCCGGKWGCGNRNDRIQKSHNRRRHFEVSLWKLDYSNIIKITEQNREKTRMILRTLN